MKQESERLYYISVLRVCSMMLIVLFHSLCFYTGVWWYLHSEIVPLWKVISGPTVKIGLTTFVFISGYLFGYMYLKKRKYRDIKSFLLNKFRRLMIPYFFWGALMIITMPMVHITWLNLFTGLAHLWFLLVLFELFIIMILLTRIGIGEKTSSLIEFLIIIISFIILYVWKTVSTHHRVLCIEEMLYYLPSFIIGFCCAKYQEVKVNKLFLFVLFVLGLLLMLILSIFDYPDSNTLYRILAIIVSMSTMCLLRNSTLSVCQSRVFKNLDNNSMGIYIFNQIIVFLLLLIPETNHFLSIHTYGGVLIVFTISLVIPWLLSNIFNGVKGLSYLIG